MDKRTLSVLLLVAGGVLLVAAALSWVRVQTTDSGSCGAVGAPMPTGNGRVDRVCDPADPNRFTTTWLLAAGGLVAAGGGGALWLGQRADEK
jgi:hypothetical protein